MKRRYKKKPLKQREIALDRIKTLFKEARTVFRKDKALANRYVKLARELSMKYKVRIPSVLKRRFCKHCYHYLMPGENLRVRTRKGNVVYYCMNCKKYMKFGYKNTQKS